MKSIDIKIRALEPEDLEFFYEKENSPEVWQWGGEKNLFSKFDLRKFIESSHQSLTVLHQKRFVIEHKQEQRIVGTIDLYDYDPINRRVSLGLIFYNIDDRNKGYGVQTLRLMKQFCFDKLCLHQIYAEVQPSNIASVALFEKCGFLPCGEKKDWVFENSKWHVVRCYQCFDR